jgi:hypothetical protein
MASAAPAGVGYLSGRDELPGDAGDRVAGNGEADSYGGATHLRVAGRERRYAYDLPGQANERATVVSRVDRCAGLDGADEHS